MKKRCVHSGEPDAVYELAVRDGVLRVSHRTLDWTPLKMTKADSVRALGLQLDFVRGSAISGFAAA